MQINNSESGSLTTMVFSVIILIAAVSFSFFLFLSFSLFLEEKNNNSKNQKQKINEMLDKVIQCYLDDDTPQIDSLKDDFWEIYHDYDEDGIEIQIEEISSMIPLNSVDPDIIIKSKLDRYLSATLTKETFNMKRQEIGWTTDITQYDDLFNGNEWENDYTLYHYNNVNIIEKLALEEFLNERLNNHLLLDAFLLERKKEYITKEEYKTITGSSYEVLNSLLGTEAIINIHFASREVMESVFQALYGKDSKSKYPYRNILSKIETQRITSEITDENLITLLEIDKENQKIAFYLGVKSYFWSVTITDDSMRLDVLLFTPPNENGQRLQVLKRKWTKID